MLKINRKNCFKGDNSTHSIIRTFLFLNNKNSSISKTFAYISIFSLVGSLFFVFIGIDFVREQQQEQQEIHYNIINIVWAENINGTENADNILGTINQDTIRGFGGNDTLTGKESGDDISGGSGNDTIYGNEGRDALRGKSGNDRIEGGEGHDRIYGDRGNDMLVGGPSNDTLTGGSGKDIFICGDATDTLTDFNVTQKDTVPENDCENIKNGNTTTTIQEQKQDNNFLFGLFK
jgi:Ca2+-binding RTX toxin-like protein